MNEIILGILEWVEGVEVVATWQSPVSPESIDYIEETLYMGPEGRYFSIEVSGAKEGPDADQKGMCFSTMGDMSAHDWLARRGFTDALKRHFAWVYE